MTERSDLVYAKVAELTWKNKGTCKNVGVTDSAGNTITEAEAVRETWRAYAECLYDKDEKPKGEDLPIEEEEDVEEEEKDSTLLKSEILAAISEMKDGKAVGVNELPAEMLKNLGQKAMQEECEICHDI